MKTQAQMALPSLALYTVAVLAIKHYSSHSWFECLYLPLLYWFILVFVGGAIFIGGLFIWIIVYAHRKRTVASASIITPEEIIRGFLSTLSIEDKKQLLLKNINKFTFEISDNNTYKNRELLSEELKDFFDKYKTLKTSDYEFSHHLIKENSELEKDVFFIGIHLEEKLCVQKDLNTIFYEHDAVDSLHLQELPKTIYDFILPDLLMKKYNEEKDLEKLKLRLDLELNKI